MGMNYTLAHHREEAMMVIIAVPGERWEVEFMNDGSVEVERFTSNGQIHDESALDELFERYADPAVDTADSPQDAELVAAEQ
jgi:hypothetical protein